MLNSVIFPNQKPTLYKELFAFLGFILLFIFADFKKMILQRRSSVQK